ncbi:MAG: 30S ribosomal protein S20 [Patescibacteria group bacterium]|nr:30S ribosomal protein S20 [Patescibacteria group bacterium]
MPIIKSAKKRMRSSARQKALNLSVKQAYKSSVKTARAQKSDETVKQAFKALDKAAKRGVIHPNKAARLKSRLAKSAV